MGTSLMGRLFRWVQRPAAVGPIVADAPGAPALASQAADNESLLVQSDALWGEGFRWPGGEAELMRLAAPLGLSPAHSLLFLGAGAGGPVRAFASTLGVWVPGSEADPALAAIARRRLQRAGAQLAKRAKIESWSPAAPAFPARGFHHALLLDVLAAGDPVATLGAAIQAVKPGGQMVIVQTLSGPRGEALGASVPRILEAHGCDLRIVEDESARHARLVLQGWRSQVRQMRGTRPSPAEAARLVEEAARWLYRTRDIRDGRCRVMRWVAIVPQLN